MTPDQSAEFLRLFRDQCEPQRYGWKRVRLDAQQRDWVIGVQHVIEAIQDIQRLNWPLIDLTDKELAEKIRESALHSLATLARAMIQNEDKIL